MNKGGEERQVNKIHRLKQWVKDELIDKRFNIFEDVVEVIADESEGYGCCDYEHKFRFNIYTETHRYRINAYDRSKDEGYLGCTSSTRKPLAGEDHTRGNDLADGPFNRETWEKIKSDIVAYELVKLAPKIDPKTQEAEETDGSTGKYPQEEKETVESVK